MNVFRWRAKVLEAGGSSFTSDVYSFGMVVWEIFSREVPWADEALSRDIYRRVVIKGDRPALPACTPADVADVMQACWDEVPAKRPSAEELMTMVRSNGRTE